MQRAKNMMYATAGVQPVPGIAMNVRSNVFVPDAEAGSEYARSHYRAEKTVERSREKTLSRNVARVFLASLFLVLSLVVIVKCIQRNSLANVYNNTNNTIQQLSLEKEQLGEKLAKVRDVNRIRYLASNEYHMVTAASVESIPVTALATRNANSYTNGQTASSPLADGHGMIIGSR